MKTKTKFWLINIILALLISCKSNHQILSSAILIDVNIEEDIMKPLTLYRNIAQDDFYEEECVTVLVEFNIQPESVKNIKTKFNSYDFSYNCYDSERKDYNTFKDIDWIIPKLKYSHFIIENQNGEFMILDEILEKECQLFDDCVYKYLSGDLSNISEPYRAGGLVCMNNLKINVSDNRIRFYYIYNPKRFEKEKGFDKSLFVSNWVNFDSIE